MEPIESTSRENLTATELQAILSNRAVADHPQPVDYGLTYEEICSDRSLWESLFKNDAYGSLSSKLKYKQGEWVSFYGGWKAALAICFPLYVLGFTIFFVMNPQIHNERAVVVFMLGMAMPGFFPGFLVVLGVVQARVESYQRRHPSSGLLAFRQALCEHKSYLTAAHEANQREHALLMQKRSYWESLNGYEFERAAAEVLEKHQFNPKVTRGSADGGVDIEVTRGCRKGVVQCKAHVARVAPATVRDLFGVMHHSNSDFGIIVSLGGFTNGAVDFARNKPIFLLDCSDLIAMQEGQDILAENFPADPTP